MRCRKALESPIGWMVQNPIVANILMMILIAGGIYQLSYIKQEVFPDYEREEVRISLSYPGASADEMEKGVVMPIEEALNSIEGIKRFKSTVRESSANVDVEAYRGYNLQKLKNDIENAVNRIRIFPKDAEKPKITERSYERTTVSLVLYGNMDRITLYNYAKQLKYSLLESPKISRVDFYGVSALQYGVIIKEEALRRYSLRIEDVVSAISSNAVDLSAGAVKTARGEIVLKLSQRAESQKEFENIPIIQTPSLKPLRLKDIAVIKPLFEDEEYFATYNDLPAIRISVRNPQNYSPIEISKIVSEKVESFNETLPEKVAVETLSSGAKIYEDRVKLLLKNAAMGLLLVLLTLSLFLQPKLAFWVMMGIPVSFLGSLLLFPVMDLSISMISLFAFILALGIVVDDAIVVGENIFRYKERGYTPVCASAVGTKEMAVPVTFSILTNIVAFIPILFIPGVTGKIFEAIPLVATAVFIISWFESLFILPAHLAEIKKGSGSLWQKRFSKSFRAWVRFRFGTFLETVLKHRYATVVIFLSLLFLALSYSFSGRMGMQLFPDTESDYVRAFVRLPPGTEVERTMEVAHTLVQRAKEVASKIERGDELVRGIYARVGRGGAHTAEVRVYLADPDIREEIMSTYQFGKLWKKECGKIDGVETLQFFFSASVGAHGSPIAVELKHHDLNILKSAAAKVAKALQSYPGVYNIDSGFSSSKEEISFTLKPLAYRLGFTAASLAREVRGRFYAAEAQRVIVNGDEVKVVVKLPRNERRKISTLNSLYLTTKDGLQVPLRELVDFRFVHTPTEIVRKNGRRVLSVEADIRPRSKALEVLNDLESQFLPSLEKEFPGIAYSFEGRETEMRENIASLKQSFVISMVLIFTLLAIPLKSYTKPLIVMSAIPFGVVGAIVGHIIMGYSLSLISLFGMVALAGIVINDALIMMQFASDYSKRGFSPFRVAKEAAIARFRPVFLTTITTFLGLMPMIFETSRQAKFLIPMAISLGFGLLFATFITLLLIPSLYMLLNDIKRAFGR